MDGLDDVDTRIGEFERDAPRLGLLHGREDLAPRRDQLRSVEQWHLREGAVPHGPAKLDLFLVGAQAPLDAVRGAELPPEKRPDPVAPVRLPGGNPFQPRPFLRHDRRFAAQHVRIAEPREEEHRILDPVHAEIEVADAPECQQDRRAFLRRRNVAAAQREGGTGRFFRSGLRRRGPRHGQHQGCRDDDRSTGRANEVEPVRHGRRVHRRTSLKTPANPGFSASGRQRAEG